MSQPSRSTSADLAVHKRKVEDVRRWISEAFEGGPTGKLRKYRRILVLSGPAGTAKTTTLRVLAREMGFEIVEWRNSMSERAPSAFIDDSKDLGDDSWMNTEALFDKFQAFLTRASSCYYIFAASSAIASTQLRSRSHPHQGLPNILHAISRCLAVALRLFIISDSDLRGENAYDDAWDGVGDARCPYVTRIAFNHIAPTLMTKALQAILTSLPL
ncbi:Rad17 cell cycle checkpoint protein-domain-containing protein [Suillus subalutaceus]|uniref:Rad17 cell cycle checkpoint protein-domain-containing protein n=1 Tax=Suillus subalutaceus TaxID=48586 RepID=UPI001B87030A|nr:Rad17 cell cycle checkpoint protein-domain-containing protein [Suillus subalutaceus]KAG1862051.1 Rad17 cell cycle checkpoint protein-domain-containing protein [Suillus subalutaceus]